jgi:alpha-1,2-mannosyltransferase
VSGRTSVATAVRILRSGDWLTVSRVSAYTRLLIVAYALALLVIVVTGTGPMDRWNRPIGTDFSEVWAAGHTVLAGHPLDPYNPELHAATQRALFGSDTPFYSWNYPPYFLALAAALALLPYLWALLIWQGTTLALYIAVMHRILGRWSSWMLAFPAVFVNLEHGQNGFLTTGLLGGGIMLLRRQPILAGVMFGLLAYKPQFALAVPVALVAGRHWTTILSAALTVAAITLLTLALFGIGVWVAFVGSLEFTRHVLLEQGNTGWGRIQSVFSAVRILGGSIEFAYAAQTVTAALVLVGLAWIWKSTASFYLKGALLAIATLLTTPYCLDYDMLALAPALAFTVVHGQMTGFRPWEKTLLALVWLSPLLARIVAVEIGAPLGILAMLAFYGYVLTRAVREGPQAAETEVAGPPTSAHQRIHQT